ncbi:hypothetical protein BV25DRAFT_1918921 [Artomyces pyxidatus]|uniref:Uncharacterized protein n=1 Tax=Artomyces pyxidatus TaxID=48021 RepID=A0ACB8SSY5_9AGAM|nr:hypothetical protein BV25DRAFT_1918921 [Artomyces pyxidatus]
MPLALPARSWDVVDCFAVCVVRPPRPPPASCSTCRIGLLGCPLLPYALRLHDHWYSLCSGCKTESQFFCPTTGGAKTLAKQMGVETLGSPPLDPRLYVGKGANYGLNHQSRETFGDAKCHLPAYFVYLNKLPEFTERDGDEVRRPHAETYDDWSRKPPHALDPADAHLTTRFLQLLGIELKFSLPCIFISGIW